MNPVLHFIEEVDVPKDVKDEVSHGRGGGGGGNLCRVLSALYHQCYSMPGYLANACERVLCFLTV